MTAGAQSGPEPAKHNASHQISTLNEKALHAALKEWYARPGDRFEVPVDGFLVDIVRDDLLIEIQTGNFSAIKRKLGRLADGHAVRLVYPIAEEKWIVRLADDGHTALGRRRSPKHGRVEDLFVELVRLPHLVSHPNFSVEVLLIHEEETRRKEEGRHWRRRGWTTHERRLLRVASHRLFETPADIASLVPTSVKSPFSTAELASSIGIPRWLAQKMAYCLRAMGAVELAGKKGNAILYAWTPAAKPAKKRKRR